MNPIKMLRFYFAVFRGKKVNIETVQKLGLLSVKIGQIMALRPDLLGTDRCRQLQKLYQNANSIKAESARELIIQNAPANFMENFSEFNLEPFAAASIGQVHLARLNSGEEVVVKLLKSNFEKRFRRDVKQLKFWVKFGLFFRPKLKKVGNPLGFLAHIEDYTLRELDFLNEIKGQKELVSIQNDLQKTFDMSLLKFPNMYEELSNSKALVMEYIKDPTVSSLVKSQSISWEHVLNLFRIHGAFMFGVGTFHGDLHPGNVMLSDDGKFTFIDTGAICYSPKRVSNSLFGFFFNLAKYQKKDAYDALLQMSDVPPTGKKLEEYYDEMTRLYDSFEGKSVSEVSLTQQMMGTVKTAVLAGCAFDETSFPIIRSLMYMDGLVLETYPDVDLITSMGPYLDEFLSLTNN